AAVFLEPLRQINLGHAEPGWIEVADIQHHQLAAIVVPRNVPGLGRAGKAVNRIEADAITIEHGLKQTADGALLAPHLASLRLLIPETAPIARGHFLGKFFRVCPTGGDLDPASLVDDRFPGNGPVLALLLEQSVDTLHEGHAFSSPVFP